MKQHIQSTENIRCAEIELLRIIPWCRYITGFFIRCLLKQMAGSLNKVALVAYLSYFCRRNDQAVTNVQ